MTTNDVQQELADGFEPGPLPPMGADGGFEPPPPAPISEPPPRLCEQGPCACYHTFSIVMDSAKPIASRLDEDGHAIGEAPDVRGHLEVHHYCYPTVGIETLLGSLPVTECNRWDPRPPSSNADLERRRADFLESAGGIQYKTELDLWRAKQLAAIAEEQRQIDEAQKVIAAATEFREEGPK